MSLNIWGNPIHLVDLTVDSDDEEAPAPPIPLSAESEHSDKMFVPLPANARHYNPPLVPSPGTQKVDRRTHSLPHGATTKQHEEGQSVQGLFPTVAAAQNPNFLSKGSGYVPMYTSLQSGQRNSHPHPQADKRRKLSEQQGQTQRSQQTGSSSNPSTYVQRSLTLTRPPEEPIGHDTHRSAIPQLHTQTPSISPAMKVASSGLPSVQFLNSALKSNGTNLNPSSPLSPARPRALYFQRPNDGVNKLSSRQSPVRPHATDMERKTATTIRQVEEITVDGDNENFTQNIALRTSLYAKHSNSSVIGSPIANDPAASRKRQSVARSHTLDSPLPYKEEHRDSAAFPSRASISDQGVTNPKAQSKAPNVTPPATQLGASHMKSSSAFSQEENHLLIFLKEVKKCSWKDLVVEFGTHFPSRRYATLQTHYSSKLNKRDRSLDPTTLHLPACYATEAVVDWVTVHAANPGPRVGRETTSLQHQAHQWQHIEASEEQSSDTESAHRSKRPRRAVSTKHYAWPKRNLQIEAEVVGDEFGYVDSIEFDMQTGSEDFDEELQSAPEIAVPVDNEPLDITFHQDDAILALSYGRVPYLALPQRSAIGQTPDTHEWDQLCSRDWHGTVVHVDFRPVELDVVEREVSHILNFSNLQKSSCIGISLRKRLQCALQGLPEPKFLRLLNQIYHRLPTRDRQSIEAFLRDAQAGKIRVLAPRINRLGAARPDRDRSTEPKASTLSMIRQRELGARSRRGWSAASSPLTYQFRNKLQDSLGPAYSYTGASSDIHAVAWSIDGQCFAAGAICVDDPDSMQYNRSNNLLYGDVSFSTIHELGGHSVDRPKTESGPNSTHAMYASQDPKLYKTVSAVAFSPNGKYMFSGGYDHCVCIWQTKTDGAQPTLEMAMKHKAEIDMLAVNRSGLLATASKKGDNHAIKVIAISEDDPTNFSKRNLGSRKAAEKPDYKILPTALHFSPRYENLLLAGFGANARSDGRDTNGDICMWDINAPETHEQLHVHGSGKNVFDLAFHPHNPWFAVGCVAGQNVNRGIRSLIRIYDEVGMSSNNTDAMKYSMRMELDCKALDMNDVVWCPGDDHLIAAGCTSGRAYVWDVRWPDRFLRELAHGRSLMPLDDYTDREITDTGIRFLSWGDNATRLYTGSSDGVVKVWNVVRSEEDTFVKDLITTDSGIMSGSFSPDKSKLVLGEVNGSINVLEVGREDCSIRNSERLKYVAYQEIFDSDEGSQPEMSHNADSGIAAAAELLETRQMMTVPMGVLPIRQAVQGPEYAGPFDAGIDAPFLREQALEFQSNLSLSRKLAPQCAIRLCANATTKITSEEMGDSGRSADRIPDELRRQLMASPSSNAISGKSRCTNCGRTARPEGILSGTALCERCSFACLRCSAASSIETATSTFACATCDRTWDMGALGYECTKESLSHAETASVPSLKRYNRDLSKAKQATTEQPDDYSFGDEMNALTDYYFGLAIDRPESPPL